MRKYIIFYFILCVYVIIGVEASLITKRGLYVTALISVGIPVFLSLIGVQRLYHKPIYFWISFWLATLVCFFILEVTNLFDFMVYRDRFPCGFVPGYVVPDLFFLLCFVSVIYVVFSVVFVLLKKTRLGSWEI